VKSAEEIAVALHEAADYIAAHAPRPDLDALAEAGSRFLESSDLEALDTDGTTETLNLNRQSLGYGVMLGYLAAGRLR
jgi:hypothetical protein